MNLFEEEHEADESPIDETNITTIILYFSKEELRQFKKQCKAGMKKMYGAEAMSKANISDFLNTVTRLYSENENNQG